MSSLPNSLEHTRSAGRSRIDSKIVPLEKILLAAWLTANLIIGALIVHDYGMSVDEPNNYRYAADTLGAYPSLFGILYEPSYDSSYDGHGPAFVAIAAIFVRTARAILPTAFEPDLWHYSYFVTFVLTGLCLYWLARRWFSAWTAWGLLILFSTQPLMLGHAFMNPKDIPFMFFLTLSVVLGFRMVDGLPAEEAFVSLERRAGALRDGLQKAEPRRRRRLLLSLALAAAATAALILFSAQVRSFIEQVVVFFYAAEPDTWAGRWFRLAARSASGLPVEDYVSKALRLFLRVEQGVLAAAVLFFLAYSGLVIHNTTLSRFLRETWTRRRALAGSLRGATKHWRGLLDPASLKGWFVEFFRALRDPRLLLAGLALGLATGVRAIGPLAGAVVVFYLLVRLRSRAWPMALAYFLIGGLVTFLAWPRLWDAPMARYLEALGIASNFPHFPGRVLFGGGFYGPSDLPRSYLPVLLNIQLSEPALLCIYLGLGVLAWRLLRGRVRADLLLYTGLGFALPLLALILFRPPLYHNFRQALFLIPALFMLAAPALELVLSRLGPAWIRVALIAALALPGLYSTAQLHPYEYVYYNSLVGGPAGAVNRYELDYWRISLREAALELNEVAAPGSLIVVTRSAGLFARYARPDLVVDKPVDSTLDLSGGYDYIVQVTRWDNWDLYPEVENIVIVERAGLVLATAKDVRGISGR